MVVVLTAERLEKAKACKSSEELAALAAELIAELGNQFTGCGKKVER